MEMREGIKHKNIDILPCLHSSKISARLQHYCVVLQLIISQAGETWTVINGQLISSLHIILCLI